MTDTKQFICEFLSIPETDFAEVVINGKMVADILDAYVVHLENQKNERIVQAWDIVSANRFTSTNDTQSEYGTISIGRNHDGSVTKYPNLLNATNRD